MANFRKACNGSQSQLITEIGRDTDFGRTDPMLPAIMIINLHQANLMANHIVSSSEWPGEWFEYVGQFWTPSRSH